MKKRLFRKWEKNLPAWGEMVQGTTVLSKRTMRHLFPDGTLRTERVMGIPKSYTLYRKPMD